MDYQLGMQELSHEHLLSLRKFLLVDEDEGFGILILQILRPQRLSMLEYIIDKRESING